MNQYKKYIFGGIALLISIIILSMVGRLYEEVDAGEVVVVQHLNGELDVYDQPTSFAWQGLGKVTHYRRSNQFEFFLPAQKDDPNNSISVKWNDGGHANLSGSIRYDLPISKQSVINLHKHFGSKESLEEHLIKTNVEKAIFMCGPLMSSKESYAEKRNDLIYYIEDQASNGVYRTRQIDIEEIDPLTNAKKTTTKVEILKDVSGLPVRQEKSPIAVEGIKLYNLSIKAIKYDEVVEKQIAQQQSNIMQIQTSIAEARKAEQRAITIEKEGEASAASAKWEQEVKKAEMVTSAEARNAQALLDVKTAELYKRKRSLEGEADGAYMSAVTRANGNLDAKLSAYKEVQKYWADAFSNYQGALVPSYVSGSAGSVNAGTQFMEMMMMKTARDLNIDVTTNEGGGNRKK